MNLNRLEAYARQARREFNAAVTDRAALYGLTAEGIEAMTKQGDVVLIGARPFAVDIAEPRERLADQISCGNFEQVMEAVAYTWFNRFIAIRYMELHDYLDHGYRVLSHPKGQDLPEILTHAADVELPGLDLEKVVELKLDGAKDEELYRLLLKAQCNALHTSMPFLFDRIGDKTELLLPANLLHTDSLIRKLTRGIEESEWEHIEIIGWLYQFYISERKEQVIGKVVAPFDIPAATQLFTPNWIVKYLVQNSLGAKWLATYPYSQIRKQMDYFIEPAEQTDEVAAQLKAITPSTFDPETLTLVDPACGSGHILVEAYDLFKDIYLERGYRAQEVAQLILKNNLFGLDIDDRAAQLTGFSLMMKGRADDRRLFDRHIDLNVLAIVDSTNFDSEPLVQDISLSDFGLRPSDLTELARIFAQATTFGSLIQVPEGLAAKIAALKELSDSSSPNVFVADALNRLRPLVHQAELLATRYHAVIANPPYMGSQFHVPALRHYLRDTFPNAKKDLFACFIERGYTLAKSNGYCAMITMQSWMFLSSFQKMRDQMLREKTICTMAHLGAGAFGSISGAVVQTTAFVLQNQSQERHKPVFFRLVNGSEESKRLALEQGAKRYVSVPQDEFRRIPGSPVAYWASNEIRQVFFEDSKLSSALVTREGMTTGSNKRFLRYWFEVSAEDIGFGLEGTCKTHLQDFRWFPYQKGGTFRRWSGNNEFVVNWFANGQELRSFADPETGRIRSHNYNGKYAFRSGLTWSSVSSGTFAVRLVTKGFMFDAGGPMGFPLREEDRLGLTGFLNSSVVGYLLGILAPTINFKMGIVLNLPLLRTVLDTVRPFVRRCADISLEDWNAYERSWDFRVLPLLALHSGLDSSLQNACKARIAYCREVIAEAKHLEEENNRHIINTYGLSNELTYEVPAKQITLTVNPAYRYGGKLAEEEQWSRFRHDTLAELVSFAIGCIMGRYSLDEPGLIYAHSGNAGFDPSRFSSFPADEDGIVPLTERDWFADDAAQRLVKFISVAWNSAHIEDNLTFLADNLDPRNGESSRETLRRYLCDKFFKDHLQTYKKRPIYWLFSSGKLRSFQCLVYLHRYNAGTLARMRTEYVIPLQGMMASRVRQLERDIEAAPSNSQRKRLEKERGALVGQGSELQAFDEKLRHFADQRISLDLDDGVKVNYGKFGDLLAEVEAVTGIKSI